MSQTLRVTPVVGLPQFTGWSHVLEHIIDPETRCVFCFSIHGDNASNVGREIVENILSIPPRSAQGLYQAIEDSAEICANQDCQLSMVAGVFRHNRSVFAAIDGSVVLKRDQKVGKIVEAGSEIAVIEGKYQLDDAFVFCTSQAREFLSEIELQFKRGFDSDGVITSIVPSLHALEDSSLSGLGFVAVVDEEKEADIPQQPATFEITQEEEQDNAPLISIERDEPKVEEMINEEQIPDAVPLTTAQSEKRQPQNLSKVIATAKHIGVGIWAFIVWFVKVVLTMFRSIASLFSSKTYVGAPPKKKIITWLVIGVVGIVAAAGTIWWFAHQSAKQDAAVQAAVAPFETELAQIKVDAETTPIPAREHAASLITTLQAQLTEAEAIGDKKKMAAFTTLLEEAKTVYQDISGRDEVSELPVFYDLRLVSSDFITSTAGSNQNVAYFVDSGKKSAVVLDVTTKQVNTQNLESIGEITAVASGTSDDDMVLLADGIYLQGLEADDQPELIKDAGDSNRDGTLIKSFGSYVYVFNPAKRNIYRYIEQQDEDQYSDPIGWLLDPLGVPFESISSWAIDGEIWMGTTNGEILRFASGRTEDFSITGLQDPFSSMLQIVTKEDLDQIWVLEHEKNRVVILNKNGEFLREIKSSSLGAATNIILDQTGQNAFIVSGSSVFEVSLQ